MRKEYLSLGYEALGVECTQRKMNKITQLLQSFTYNRHTHTNPSILRV